MRVLALTLLADLISIVPAAAQTQTRQAQAPRERPYAVSVHLQFGRLSQSARESFTAILGTTAGQVFGGGAEVTFRNGLFVRGDVSYFGATGERVDVEDGEIVPLGIPLTLSLVPIEFSGGYRLPAWRFGSRGRRVAIVPYVGAGAGAVRYHEETDDAHPDERVDHRYTSYHLLVGVDLPVGSRVVIGSELTRRWVPNGLGVGGLSQALGETDLGGSTFLVRIRFVVL